MGLLSVHEVADTLNVHEKTIRRYINNGHLDAKKIGGQWRIEETALETLMNEGTCCHTVDANHDISGDDFCVFMDSDLFNSNEQIQICSIIDYYTKDLDYANIILEKLKSLAYDLIIKGENVKIEFNYSESEDKARFVVWSTPYNIILFTQIVQQMEKK